MPHIRDRFALELIRKQASLWPVIGILGPRQAGKTTLAHVLLSQGKSISMDDLQIREEAERSPRTFLAKYPAPLILDEVQKAPEIFDAIKLQVDRKRVPGSYILTGSSSFSAKVGIRESLTGRIGLVELFPMTLAELHQEPGRWHKAGESQKPRFGIPEIMKGALSGGMPVPAFLRESEQRDFYWRSWLESTLLRDLPRFFKKGYDGDFAYALLGVMGRTFANGELPTLKHFPYPARKVRTYLSAMQEIFLVRRILCHPQGIGKECWLLMDSGLATHVMGNPSGEGATLTLIRHLLWNEWACQTEYQGRRFERAYYKSAQGSPVDSIRDGVPYRIVPSVTAVTRQLKWEERPLAGAMKKLGAKVGYLVAPIDQAVPPPKKGGIGILPWGSWS